MKKLFVLLLMSLLMVNCGVDESSVGESKSTGVVFEPEKSTAEKVVKYAVYTVAGVGVLVCVNSGLKAKCVRTVKDSFLPATHKVADTKLTGEALQKAKRIMKKAEEASETIAEGQTFRDYSNTFYGKIWKKIFAKKPAQQSVEEAGEAASDASKKGAQGTTDDAAETATEGAQSEAK